MSIFSNLFKRAAFSGQATTGELDNLVVLRDSSQIVIQDLKFYYDENFMNDPLIGELISSLRRFFEDESSDESDIFDRSDDDCYFSY